MVTIIRSHEREFKLQTAKNQKPNNNQEKDQAAYLNIFFRNVDPSLKNRKAKFISRSWTWCARRDCKAP